jgi:hypothetical protein
MDSPLPYDVMSIVYKQLSIEDKSNLITSMQIFKKWFWTDLKNELFCKRGCVLCVPSGDTKLRLISPDAKLDYYTNNQILFQCGTCKMYFNSYDMPRDCDFAISWPDIYCPNNIYFKMYCLKCTIANDEFKLCEVCQKVTLYHKKCVIHYDPLVTRCNKC